MRARYAQGFFLCSWSLAFGGGLGIFFSRVRREWLALEITGFLLLRLRVFASGASGESLRRRPSVTPARSAGAALDTGMPDAEEKSDARDGRLSGPKSFPVPRGRQEPPTPPTPAPHGRASHPAEPDHSPRSSLHRTARPSSSGSSTANGRWSSAPTGSRRMPSAPPAGPSRCPSTAAASSTSSTSASSSSAPRRPPVPSRPPLTP